MSDKSAMQLTHVDRDGKLCMVDVGNKTVSARHAVAEALVVFPADVYAHIQSTGRTAKGSIVDVANIAGVMAAKRTADLIPLCHPMMLDKCQLTFEYLDDLYAIQIQGSVSIHHKTGVEMEALMAVSVAALTVYDMCKALSHDICIQHVRLVAKTGGKQDFLRDDARRDSVMHTP